MSELRQLRLAAGASLGDVAKLANTTPASVSRMEIGERFGRPDIRARVGAAVGELWGAHWAAKERRAKTSPR